MSNILVLIDPQNKFIQIDGAVSVPGALLDTARTCLYIKTNIALLDEIVVTLDCRQNDESEDNKIPANLQEALSAWESKSKKKVTYVYKRNGLKTDLDNALIQQIDKHERIIFAGQPLSHSVADTVKHIMDNINNSAKVAILTDCCSNAAESAERGKAFLSHALDRGASLTPSTYKLNSTPALIINYGYDKNNNHENQTLLKKDTGKSKWCCFKLF